MNIRMKQCVFLKFHLISTIFKRRRKKPKKIDLTSNWWCVNQIFWKFIHRIIELFNKVGWKNRRAVRNVDGKIDEWWLMVWSVRPPWMFIIKWCMLLMDYELVICFLIKATKSVAILSFSLCVSFSSRFFLSLFFFFIFVSIIYSLWMRLQILMNWQSTKSD